MTTQTLDKTDAPIEDEVRETTDPAAKKPTKEKKERRPSRLGGALRRLAPEKSSDGLPVVIWAVFFRSVVLIADYLLALSTAMVLIPMLGAWLHQQSGAAGGQLTMAGTIAMWIAPLAFLVIVLAAGEIAAMRAMWGWSTRRIQAVRDARAEAQAPSAPAPRANRRTKKTTNKRSK